MKYEKDGTPVTLVPSTPEFVFTLKGGKVIIPHRNALTYYTFNGKRYAITIREIINELKRGDDCNQYLKYIDLNDTATYTVIVPVNDKPTEGGQRRKTRNYKNKYSRKASSSLSRKYNSKSRR
jgi:hypothetical protein